MKSQFNKRVESIRKKIFGRKISTLIEKYGHVEARNITHTRIDKEVDSMNSGVRGWGDKECEKIKCKLYEKNEHYWDNIGKNLSLSISDNEAATILMDMNTSINQATFADHFPSSNICDSLFNVPDPSTIMGMNTLVSQETFEERIRKLEERITNIEEGIFDFELFVDN